MHFLLKFYKRTDDGHVNVCARNLVIFTNSTSFSTIIELKCLQRAEIINGTYEPTDTECEWASDDEELSGEMKSKVKLDEDKKEEEKKKEGEEEKKDENVNGIPEFWLTILKNVGMLAEMVQEHDEPILKHLEDVRIIFLNNPMVSKRNNRIDFVIKAVTELLIRGHVACEEAKHF